MDARTSLFATQIIPNGYTLRRKQRAQVGRVASSQTPKRYILSRDSPLPRAWAPTNMGIDHCRIPTYVVPHATLKYCEFRSGFEQVGLRKANDERYDSLAFL